MTQLIFKQMQSPGDLMMLTVAIRDLHLTYPGWFETDVISCYPEVFFNNKYITYLPKDQDIKVIDLDYGPYLHDLRKKKLHFSDCFIYMFNERLNLFIRKTCSYGYINLTPYELSKKYFLSKFGLKKPYWVINAGIKCDIPLKQYPPYLYQKVVNDLNNNSLFYCDIVQTGHDHHIHPKLKGVINLVGKTNNLRDYFALIYHSEGCIGPVSLQMHVAAIFNKPCIVIAGGREEPSWERYNNHIYLHTIGKLDCCRFEGCWKKSIGECITINENQRYAKCMEMISTDIVVTEVMQYQELKINNLKRICV
jgi:ADP-heptose:LPS heptosyltransferase